MQHSGWDSTSGAVSGASGSVFQFHCVFARISVVLQMYSVAIKTRKFDTYLMLTEKTSWLQCEVAWYKNLKWRYGLVIDMSGDG